MDSLGRYYTADLFSKLLINKLSTDNPTSILELGVGGGSLIKAALTRWENASYYAADVDQKSITKIKKELPFVNTFHIDTLSENVSEKLNIQHDSIDIAICNPPYLKLKNEICYNQLFEEANLSDCQQLKLLTTDIIFLAKNLQLVKKTGELGIILPDSLITGKEFERLRTAILKAHTLKGIIQLPESIFPKTEALTHILIIEKGTSSQKKTPLLLANSYGEIVDQIEVDNSNLINRMDFKFHSWNNTNGKRKESFTLGSINASIERGSLPHSELKGLKDEYLHTTNIIHKKSNLSPLSSKRRSKKYRFTQKGDILLTRVGSIGKLSMIAKGHTLFSDCLYRIRVSQEWRQKVWESLCSEKGQSWLKANSHGVCAKVISKRDLSKFPIS